MKNSCLCESTEGDNPQCRLHPQPQSGECYNSTRQNIRQSLKPAIDAIKESKNMNEQPQAADKVNKLETDLLSAQVAIAEHNRSNQLKWPNVPLCQIKVDLSELDKHDAEVRAHGWNEGREHERKCAEAVRKPLVDALERMTAMAYACTILKTGDVTIEKLPNELQCIADDALAKSRLPVQTREA